jgi:DNA/RNA endonuclease YhcR with UshA esterase domain
MTRTLLGTIVVGIILAGHPLPAHHAGATKYDEKKPVTLKGTVTKVEWMNPHVYYYIDVKDSSGKVQNWAVEGAPPNVLYRRGWKKDSLKAGDVVTVEGFLPRQAGLHDINGRTVTLADGRRVFGGAADGLPGGPADR